MKQCSKSGRGFTLIEIMIVVSIIGLLLAIAGPNYVRTRAAARKNACISNLKTLDGAKQRWALENNKSGTDVPGLADIFSVHHGYISRLPVCPSGGTYKFNDINTLPECSMAATEAHSL